MLSLTVISPPLDLLAQDRANLGPAEGGCDDSSHNRNFRHESGGSVTSLLGHERLDPDPGVQADDISHVGRAPRATGE